MVSNRATSSTAMMSSTPGWAPFAIPPHTDKSSTWEAVRKSPSRSSRRKPSPPSSETKGATRCFISRRAQASSVTSKRIRRELERFWAGAPEHRSRQAWRTRFSGRIGSTEMFETPRGQWGGPCAEAPVRHTTGTAFVECLYDALEAEYEAVVRLEIGPLRTCDQHDR